MTQSRIRSVERILRDSESGIQLDFIVEPKVKKLRSEVDTSTKNIEFCF